MLISVPSGATFNDRLNAASRIRVAKVLVQPNSADKCSTTPAWSKELIGPKRTQIAFGGSL